MACRLFVAKPLPEPMLILSIGPLRTKPQWNSDQIQKFTFMKTHLEMSSAKCRSFCPGIDELNWFQSELIVHKQPIRHDQQLQILSWLRYTMETIVAILALYKGNPSITIGFPSQSASNANLIFTFLFAWKSSWTNSRNADALRPHDATVRTTQQTASYQTNCASYGTPSHVISQSTSTKTNR